MEKLPKLKTRSKLSALDIKYLAHNYSKQLSGCVLNNVQDITVKSYIFKLGRANQRENLLIESGIKMLLVDTVEETRDKPNKFSQKLRKHIKGLFLDSIEQIGVERVIKITFKGADKEKFYAKGNIILTDSENVTLCCLRDHQYSENEKVQMKEVYPLHKAAQLYFDKIDINQNKIQQLLKELKKKHNLNIVNQLVPCAHQQICEIFLLKNNISTTKEYDSSNEDKILEIASQIKNYYQKQNLDSEEEIKNFVKGYLYLKNGKSFEFSPIKLPYQEIYKENIEEKEFENFNECLNEHFKQFNIEKTPEEYEQEIEKQAMKKFQKIQQDQQGRLQGMQNQIELLTNQAQLVENHLKEVDGIINIVNELIGMGIANLIKDSISQAQKEGDPLASMIEKVIPETLNVFINLKNENNENLQVKIDLKINAQMNVSNLYQNRKKLLEKEEKTKQATIQVLKKAQQLAIKEIQNKKLQLKKKIFGKERKIYWFEKFYWFLTSEGYLVITARDAQQNEVLIKKYLDKNDIVFHAHIQGSAFTVIKNHTNNPVSILSINETSVAALAHSKAWNLNVVVQVYWVYADQISKTAPTGLSLPSGSFMIYGKKNFINPLKLEMGYGLLFKMDDESSLRHKGERRIKTDVMHQEVLDQQQEQQQQEESNLNNIIEQENNQQETKIQIDKKQKQKVVQQKRQKKDKTKKEEIVEEKQVQQKQNKKVNKKKQKKMQEYLEKFGGESKYEEEMRMKVQGYKKNYKLEEKKKEYEWANQDVVEIKFEDEQEEQEQEEKSEKNEENQEEKDKKKKIDKKYMEILNVGQQEENLEANFFEKFSGIPKKEDTLLQIFPVCAPYSTLQKYKYKVKLIPGPTKRGKALRLIQEIFKNQQGEEQEKELLKFMPENIVRKFKHQE